MRKPSEGLFDLIKSLKKEELKRVKQQLSTMGKKGMVHQQLLESIRQQKSYDEAVLSQGLKVNSLSAAKKRLFDLILDVCSELNRKKVPKLSIMQELIRCCTLMDRGLAIQAKHQIYQLKKRAIAEEQLWLLPMINHELSCIESKYFRYASFDEQSIQDFVKETIEQVNQLQDLVKILGVETQILFFTARVPKGLLDKNKLRSILDALVIPNLEKAPSVKVQITYHQVKGIYHYFKQEFDLSIKHLLHQVELTRVHAHRTRHINAINTALMVMITDQQYESASVLLEEYEVLAQKSSDLTELLRCYILRLSWCRFTFNIETGKHYQQLFERQRSSFEAFPFAYLALFNIAVVLFYNKEFEAAEKYMSQAVAFDAILPGEEYLGLFLNIVILYEQEEWRLLESRIKSLYRKILEQDSPLVLERYLLNKFKKLSQANLEQRKKLYLKMQEELPTILIEAQENTFINVDLVLDFESWVISKIERRPLLEILKEKALRL